MTCKLCDRFWESFWMSCDAWERQHSNENELFANESEQSWELIQRAAKLDDCDPEAAFQFYVTAANNGSVWCMEAVGWRYWSGSGVIADLSKAEDYYRRAVSGGAWMARIGYARLLSSIQRHEEAETVLKDGMDTGFHPLHFWLARTRYDRSESPEVAREVRPMLRHAAREGHLGAQQMLSRMMLTGKFGLLEIPRGIGLAVNGALKFASARH
ncbi:sel1 repeat family protein [Qipengyuania marisflavi]|uniref:Sel1 repeat family protein n=1 Tax=Qipengyuania marisflavi TaxID=2486356 RepID=A0A5S3P5A6_9SPHN|nr:sel1 repeat family protein [Qipengyuania marisflavi]TMM48096.1 sel1 repeat family protein [Qipengyuania marisflavi]